MRANAQREIVASRLKVLARVEPDRQVGLRGDTCAAVGPFAAGFIPGFDGFVACPLRGPDRLPRVRTKGTTPGATRRRT